MTAESMVVCSWRLTARRWAAGADAGTDMTEMMLPQSGESPVSTAPLRLRCSGGPPGTDLSKRHVDVSVPKQLRSIMPGMKSTRRDFLFRVAAGSFASLVLPASARAKPGPRVDGYGPLVPDRNGILDLPRGFNYHVFSREGDAMVTGGIVPGSHDGMAAFPAGRGDTWLVRNHEVDPDAVVEDGVIPVARITGITYDPEGVGGTTTLLVNHSRRLAFDRVSLAGTIDNCAGGPTPWQTWLTCEETTDTLARPHGYVFEVDPEHGGNPAPIVPMGRFEHEAVSFTSDGIAFLTEDASGPFGCLYRFEPQQPLGGLGSLHGGGTLTAMRLTGVAQDLSEIQIAGTVLPVSFVPVPNANPGDGDTPTREQARANGATPIPKLEGTWRGLDGSIWFVSSRGDGPNAEDPEDISAATHSGQIWKYDLAGQSVELVAILPVGSPFDGPDNITVGPHGFALACTDGEDDQWLVGITENGQTFPFAFNRLNEEEFAGVTFSPDGHTLFVNIQGPPGLTFAIWGPWASRS
jgi:secreted PhoX family phosphatase